MKGTVGPVDLGGMKSGFQFSVEIYNNCWYSNDGTKYYTSDIDNLFAQGGWDAFPLQFQKTVKTPFFSTVGNFVQNLAPKLFFFERRA